MPRNLEFDPDEALAKAVKLFWIQGVEGTSISELVAATGVNRSGLYSVFGSKQGLYKQSMQHYLDNVVRVTFKNSIGFSGADISDIRRHFCNFEEYIKDPETFKGCLMCFSSLSVCEDAKAVRPLIAEVLAEIRDYFLNALCRSRVKGELSLGVNEEELADSLLANVLCVANLCRAPEGRPLVTSYVRQLTLLIDSWTTKTH